MEIEIVKSVQSIANNFFDVFFRVVTYAGSFFAFLFVVLLFLLFCDKRYTIFMAISFVVFWGMSEIAKLIIARPRPFAVSTDIIQKVSASNFSMPSGHSFAVTFLIGMIVYYLFKNAKSKSVKIISVTVLPILGLLVGLSRIYLGVHFLTDVLAGFTYGIVCAILSIILYKKIISKSNKKDAYGTQNTIK